VINKETINTICNAHLAGTSVYVTAIRISSDNKINVFLDGDEGVTIKDCVTLSRAIEGELNRDKEDFSLDVSSHGAATPLAFPRQYKRHIGRELEIVKTDSSKMEGKLLSSDEEGIDLEVSSRENKTLGKGKTTVIRQYRIPFSEMKETKIKLKY
jgi:ribosome maturation factor RimP